CSYWCTCYGRRFKWRSKRCSSLYYRHREPLSVRRNQ
ncbi:acyl-[acyl-carrier-protein]-UDP-N-acetylglucosamine O-acyltransferase, partial [Chlamydia psittaci 03DC29]